MIEPEDLLAAVTDETRAVILCNPNNPTGTYLPLDGVRGLADGLPDGRGSDPDEAYVEFVDDPAYADSHVLALERANVVVARTFSKAHGLAGLRVGYGVSSERIADYAERVRFPVSVNLAAQVAATASMRAREKVLARARFVIRERGRLQEAFGDAGLDFIPSQGNFVMVRFGAEAFERAGVLVREGEALGFPGWSRVTVGNSAGERPRPGSPLLSRTLGVIGVGLIGGSIGLAARGAGWEVVGVDEPEVLERAEASGAIDRASTLKEVRGADLVVLAAPISRVTALVEELAPTGALTTDVASAKSAIVRAAERAGLRFVGGHPMAGSQLSGVANARADLFQGARYFLTPTDTTDPDDYREVSVFVRELGAIPTAVEPEKHDLLMAALSHLPHVMAAALLKVASDISPEALSFAGPSFRDLTRVGASNPALWSDILAENAPASRRGAWRLRGGDGPAWKRDPGQTEHGTPVLAGPRSLRRPRGHPRREERREYRPRHTRREPSRRLRRGHNPHGVQRH